MILGWKLRGRGTLRGRGDGTDSVRGDIVRGIDGKIDRNGPRGGREIL